jgi:hypothetical protein
MCSSKLRLFNEYDELSDGRGSPTLALEAAKVMSLANTNPKTALHGQKANPFRNKQLRKAPCWTARCVGRATIAGIDMVQACQAMYFASICHSLKPPRL